LKREKTFGHPESYGLDRKARRRVIAYARGWSATHREPKQHIGPITRAGNRWQPLVSFASKAVRDSWSTEVVDAVLAAYPDALAGEQAAA
jgi:hypothetical protein